MRRTTRRNFLRGMSGAALSLPWMESLCSAAPSKPVAQRMAHFYVPIGVVRRGFFPGEAEDIIPKGNLGNVMTSLGKQDPNFSVKPLTELTPTMQPLDGFQQKINLITGMDRTFQQGTDVHAQCASCYLSSAEPYTIKGTAWPLNRTLDHLVADQIGTQTPFPTLEFSCNSHRDNKESIYFDNISWYGTGHLAPSIRDPRKMYRRLFSTQEIDQYRDITDLVLEDAHAMRKQLGTSDREKFSEYFESIRTIELQMDRLEKMKAELSLVKLDEPPEAYLPRGEYIRLMGDLMVVALQTGLTNVTTFMVGPERWDTPYKFESLFDTPRSHHQMSHNQTKMINDLLKVDRFHMEQYVYLLKRMDSIQESDGTTLLDNTLFTYGSGLGDGSTHQYNDLPIIVAGGGKRVYSGQHINMPEGTPLANLWLTQAQLLGLPMKRFADSTGPIGSLIAG
ncbi:DUF1552 domain-containing protein [Rubinisphaera sp.]|uniref:DUF1552 domain-containing protein n=1 Tax=Rubinisphaera sp. TaxID=2024857 RepID=UPI000C0CA7E8|nr:DUF1552 domain-containing protein [Rubinisphaera sp.]MBV11491.1 hypothetical protein [Rubinisphaera sp.]HCS52918.1 hypothetical protein [Planctomycetaceae bacterium]|tara:strand:- start:19786 stop:21135 length:1350 start_codon:yes stop_codon:yes gene_type:complete